MTIIDFPIQSKAPRLRLRDLGMMASRNLPGKAIWILGITAFVLCQAPIFFLAQGVVDELDFWAGTFCLTLFAAHGQSTLNLLRNRYNHLQK